MCLTDRATPGTEHCASALEQQDSIAHRVLHRVLPKETTRLMQCTAANDVL